MATSVIGKWEYRYDFPAKTIFLRFEFFSDGTYRGSNSNGENFTGQYTVDGNTVLFSNLPNRSLVVEGDRAEFVSPAGSQTLKRV